MINEVNVEQVTPFKYFGTDMNESCHIKQEIRKRIGQAKDALMCMRNLFTSTELNLQLSLRMIHCYVFQVLLYGCESGTLNEDMENKLQAFELYLHGRMLRIPWIRKVTNEEVLHKVYKSIEFVTTVNQRKLL